MSLLPTISLPWSSRICSPTELEPTQTAHDTVGPSLACKAAPHSSDSRWLKRSTRGRMKWMSERGNDVLGAGSSRQAMETARSWVKGYATAVACPIHLHRAGWGRGAGEEGLGGAICSSPALVDLDNSMLLHSALSAAVLEICCFGRAGKAAILKRTKSPRFPPNRTAGRCLPNFLER